MQHLVITRFNVRLPGRPAPSESWLRNRLVLFRTYPAASMRSQSARYSRWLVFCDADSPAWFPGELSSALQGLPAAEAVWVDAPFWDCVREEIATRVAAGPSKLITTRLDNDDAIARDYLAAVQAAAQAIERGAVNLFNGAQLRDARVYRRADPSNPFISLVEKASHDPLTVFLDEHHRLERHVTLHQVRGAPLWLQVIHGRNLDNSVRGVRVPARPLLDAFDLDVPTTEKRAEVLLDQIRTGSRMAWRVAAAPHRRRWAWKVLRARLSRGPR
jgi:hypothetical protein